MMITVIAVALAFLAGAAASAWLIALAAVRHLQQRKADQ